MDATVDARRQMVIVDGTEWPFTLDLRRGLAVLRSPDHSWRVRPQRWSEKWRLARFASCGESFVRQQLWAMCIQPDDVEPTAAEQEALFVLAAWLSAGGSGALPLDSALLTRVAMAVCRQLGIGPAALDRLPAYEVEAMWQLIPESSADAAGFYLRAEEFTHRIELVPDQQPGSTATLVPAPQREVAGESLVPIAVSSSPEVMIDGRAPNAPRAARPVAGQELSGVAPVPEVEIAPATETMLAGRAESSSGEKPVSVLSETGSPAPQTAPLTVAGHDAVNSLEARTQRADAAPVKLQAKAPGQLPAIPRFRVLTNPSEPSRPLSPPAAGPEPLPLQYREIVAIPDAEKDELKVSAPLREAPFPIPEPFLRPVAPAEAPGATFEDFVTDFGERLQAAAAELGIIEER